MSPLEVEILLHYFYSPNDHPNVDAPAVQSAITGFVKKGLLEPTETGVTKWRGNLKALTIYVNAVCSVPLPKQVWIIEKPVT